MNTLFSGVLALSLLVPGLALAQDDSAQVADAKDAALSWLALCDAGDYAQSWEQAATAFKAAETQAKWQEALQSVRAPLGELKSRVLTTATVTHSLPGAPDGDYVVIKYHSRFANKANATETVTPQREQDGSWKVAGYYIK